METPDNSAEISMRERATPQVGDLPSRKSDSYVSTYANFGQVTLSERDVVFSFFEVIADEEEQVIENKARVVMPINQILSLCQVFERVKETLAQGQASSEKAGD